MFLLQTKKIVSLNGFPFSLKSGNKMFNQKKKKKKKQLSSSYYEWQET